MTDTFRELCAEVLAFHHGQGCYNFSGLNPYDRDNAAFDAWQDIRQRLKSALAQPEPVGPDPIDYRRWHEAHSEDCNTWSEELPAPLTCRKFVEAIAWANYCLTRFGRPAAPPDVAFDNTFTVPIIDELEKEPKEPNFRAVSDGNFSDRATWGIQP